LNDVIIFEENLNKMVKNLRKIFLRLRAANLKINPKKCVKYLGHVISAGGVTTDPEKIVAVSGQYLIIKSN